MPTVAVNAPKTPVTKGSNGIAMATLPNICKMPGPPAPFVPVPLPNIGTSDNGPKGYSTSVTIEGNPVAIQGSSFLSKGDVAAMGTGGGIVSMNVQGPTTFIGPGSLDTKIEGKNVQLLGDPMLNNCGPPGSPANSATMVGVLQAPLIAQGLALDIVEELWIICQAKCNCQSLGQGQNCISQELKVLDALSGGKSNIKPEVPYDMGPAIPEPTSYPGNRRPDAIIVNDPTQPPMGSNIKAVVEIKMKRDRWRNTQKPDYERIAGDPDNLVEMNDENCTCEDTDIPVDQEQEQEQEEEEEEHKYVPDWVVPALEVVGVAALAVVAGAAIVAAAPEIAAAGLVIAGATAVFSLFSAPKESQDEA
jgi:Domain of unknown function (DUF4150)